MSARHIPITITERLGLKELVALGVGGMVGGGIFSVLGLSVSLSGHAAPIAFVLGGVIALLTGVSYARLGLAFHSDGGSFTYLEHAFRNKNIAGIGGWLLIVGYIGTMALYAYTFGVYGSAMLGIGQAGGTLHHALETLILLIFLGINLYGVRATGTTEDILVLIKVLILGIFGIVGLFHMDATRVTPFFNKGFSNVLMGAALIFVAYEGFELIPNALNEMEDPEHNLPRGILYAILITTSIYVLVALVAIGNLNEDQIMRYKEYALAVAAQPFLGQIGFLLIGLGALLSTSSAINATLFGTARLAKVMAKDDELPKAFSYTARTRPVPWVSLLVISGLTLLFVNIADLTIISSFASFTFLVIFAAVNAAAYRLRHTIRINGAIPLLGLVLTLLSLGVLTTYLAQHDPQGLMWIGIFYAGIVVFELIFSERALIVRDARDSG